MFILKGACALSNATVKTPAKSLWALTTERIVIAGVLAAITLILGFVPNLGFIPLPNAIGSATIEHIPTILGGVIAGPVVGVMLGLIFGIVSFIHAPNILFKDVTVAIFPRLFIGLTAWAVFAALKRINRDLAAAAAGFIGAATNTILVVTMIVVRGYFPVQVIVPIVLLQSICEAIIAAILSVMLTRIFFILEARMVRATDTKPRDQLPY